MLCQKKICIILALLAWLLMRSENCSYVSCVMTSLNATSWRALYKTQKNYQSRWYQEIWHKSEIAQLWSFWMLFKQLWNIWRDNCPVDCLVIRTKPHQSRMPTMNTTEHPPLPDFFHFVVQWISSSSFGFCQVSDLGALAWLCGLDL